MLSVPHSPGSTTPGRDSLCWNQPASLLGAPMHPQELGTCAPLCGELLKPWHFLGFTGPDIWHAGSPGSVNTPGEREDLAWSKPLHSNGCAGQMWLPQMQKEDTQFALESVIFQMPHKINGLLKIMLIYIQGSPNPRVVMLFVWTRPTQIKLDKLNALKFWHLCIRAHVHTRIQKTITNKQKNLWARPTESLGLIFVIKQTTHEFTPQKPKNKAAFIKRQKIRGKLK